MKRYWFSVLVCFTLLVGACSSKEIVLTEDIKIIIDENGVYHTLWLRKEGLLQIYKASGISINAIKKGVGEYISAITAIDVNAGKITSYDGLNGFSACKKLWVKNTDLSSLELLSKEMSMMPVLTAVDLSSNRISSIEGIDTCKKLEELVLSNNVIDTISFSLLGMKLRKLAIENNPITDFSHVLDLYSSLEDLSLPIHVSEKVLDLTTFQKLKDVVIGVSKEKYQEQMQHLPATLKRLLVYCPGIDSIGDITNLKELIWLNYKKSSIAHIEFEELPTTLTELHIIGAPVIEQLLKEYKHDKEQIFIPLSSHTLTVYYNLL